MLTKLFLSLKSFKGVYNMDVLFRKARLEKNALDEKLIMFVVVASLLHIVQFQNHSHGCYSENWKAWLVYCLAALNLSGDTKLQRPDPTTPLVCIHFRYKHSTWLHAK